MSTFCNDSIGGYSLAVLVESVRAECSKRPLVVETVANQLVSEKVQGFVFGKRSIGCVGGVAGHLLWNHREGGLRVPWFIGGTERSGLGPVKNERATSMSKHVLVCIVFFICLVHYPAMWRTEEKRVEKEL